MTKQQLFMEPQSHKTQPYPRGVWHSYDPKRGQHRMNAYWANEDGRHVRSFYIGHDDSFTATDLERAEAAAIEFREAYVEARNNRQVFDPHFIDNWR